MNKCRNSEYRILFLFTLWLSAVLLSVGLQRAACAQANAEHDFFEVPISFVTENKCTGEFIFVQGTALTGAVITFDASGGVHIVLHFNWKNVTATGLTSGDTYRAIQGGTIQFYAGGSDLPVETTLSARQRFVHAGAGDDLVFRFLTHTTVDANGKVAVDFTAVELICQ